MAAGMPWTDYIASLKALRGAPQVSYDGGDTAYPITARVRRLPIGSVPAYGAAEPDTVRYPNNVLVEKRELTNDGHFVEVYLRYMKLPGRVQTMRSWDEEHHVFVYLDRYMDLKGAALPAEGSVRDGKYVVRTAESPLAGSTIAEMAVEYMALPANRVDVVPFEVLWPGWFEPKRSRVYHVWQSDGAGGYNVVNLSDLVQAGVGDELTVYLPLNLVRPPGISLEQMMFRQGVTMDARAPRARRVPARRTRMYFAGSGAFEALVRQLPKQLQVMAPGARSNVLGAYIGNNTVHPAFKVKTVDLEEEYGEMVLEDVEASDPPRYDENATYCVGASIRQVRGGLHMMEVLEATESGSLKAINTERKLRIPFTATAVNFVDRMSTLAGVEQGFLLRAVSDSNADNDSGKRLRITGRKMGGAGVNPVAAEFVTLGEAGIAVLSTNRWFRLFGVQLADSSGEPTNATGNITVSIDSASSSETQDLALLCTGAGAIGDTLTVSRAVGGEAEAVTYTWGNVGGEISRLRIRDGSSTLPAGGAGTPVAPLCVGISHGSTRYGVVIYRSDVGEWDNVENYYTGALPESIASANAIEVGVTSARTAAQLRSDIQTVIDATHSGKWVTSTSDAGGAPATVYSTGAVGVGLALADVEGFPCIAFPDDIGSNLKFSYNSADDGTGTWTTVNAVTGVINAQLVSLAEVDGRPAIAFIETSGDLTYVRASNATGSSWGAAVTVATPDDAYGPSLLVVDGRPAIAYYNVTTNEVCYVRASDSTGGTWGTPVVIEAVGAVTVLARVSLAIVNGRPAVAYRAETGAELKYARASDASGTAWGAAVVVDSDAADTGNYASLVVVSGKPAVAYYDGTNGNLLYIRSLDENGAAWASNATTVASTGTVGLFCTMAVVSGRPAIAYYDMTNTQLMFVRASDATGTAWDTPAVIDTTGDVGEWAALAIIDGNPAVAYLDDTNDDVKFARNTATDGSDPWTAAYDLIFSHVTKGAVTNATLNNAGSWVGAVSVTQEGGTNAAANTIQWSGTAATAAANLEAVLGNPTAAIAAGLAGSGTTTLAAITDGTVTVSRSTATVHLVEIDVPDLSYAATAETGGTVTVTLPTDNSSGTVVATIAAGSSTAFPAVNFDNADYQDANLLPRFVVTTDAIGVGAEQGLLGATGWRIGVGKKGSTEALRVAYQVSSNLTDWTDGAGQLSGGDAPFFVTSNNVNTAAVKRFIAREYATHTFSAQSRTTKYVRLKLTGINADESLAVDAYVELDFPTA